MVKTKLLPVLIMGFMVIQTMAHAQQMFNMDAIPGTPWSYKNTLADRDIPFISMPAVDNQAMRDEDAATQNGYAKPYRFGYDHIVSYNLENSGAWTELENGDGIWRLGIRSAGAYTLSFTFKSIILPKGCLLYIMNAAKTEKHGAFDETYASDDRMLGTELLTGDAAIIELYVPAAYRSIAKLELWRVTHAYVDVVDMAKSFGNAGSCMNNVNCPAYSIYDDQIRSVVCLVNGGEFCTGALINNTCNDGRRFVLTANHCGSSGFGAWTFRFNWEAPGCPNPGSNPASNSVTGGATQRAVYVGADMSMVEITNTIPAAYGVYYAGWDRNDVPTNNAYGIHHPSGDIKKISFTTGMTSTATYSTATCWKTGTWTDGVTEPGSSGSPLFNSGGQIIGQLFGGPSACAYENNATNGVDYYGKLSLSWTGGGTNGTRLSNWLDPSSCNTGATNIPGYDPNAVSLTYDAQVQTVSSPTGSICAGPFSPSITIRNNGTTTLTSMTINYQVDGGPATGYSWTGSLATGASTVVTMPSITIAAGAHTYTATIVTASLNGSNTDLNTSNNAQTSNYTGIATAAAVALPFTEGFETVTFPPTNWINENPDGNVGNGLWVRTTTASGFGGSTACAKIDQGSSGSTTAGQVDNLVTPFLNLSTASTPINLTFSVANARYNATYYDSLIVWISTNCGASWTRLASYGNNSGVNALATAADITSAFTPSAAQWVTKTINLDAYASATAVKIRFQSRSGWGNNTFIDDVNIAGVPSTPPVASYTMNDNSICAGQSVTYTNTSSGATSFNWSFPGGSPGSGSTSPITVTYNTPGTYTTTLTATNSFGANTSTQTVTVNALPSVSFTGSFGPYCPNDGAVNLSGGSPAGGSYSGPGVAGNQFSPAMASAGTHTITYTYTDANGCSAQATQSITVLACLGIGTDEFAYVTIYPNPATDMITIKGLQNTDYSYHILNTLGQVIQAGKLTSNTLDLSAFPHGTYYLQISNRTWKLIKM